MRMEIYFHPDENDFLSFFKRKNVGNKNKWKYSGIKISPRKKKY